MPHDIPETLAAFELRLALPIERLASRRLERMNDPAQRHLRCDRAAAAERLQDLVDQEATWESLCDREPVDVLRAVELGYFLARARMESPDRALAAATAESLRASGAMEWDDLMPLARWCARLSAESEAP